MTINSGNIISALDFNEFLNLINIKCQEARDKLGNDVIEDHNIPIQYKNFTAYTTVINDAIIKYSELVRLSNEADTVLTIYIEEERNLISPEIINTMIDQLNRMTFGTVLKSIIILGDSIIPLLSDYQYICKAYWSDGSITTATSDQNTQWSISSPENFIYAQVSNADSTKGIVTTANVTSEQIFTLKATYLNKVATKQITIKELNVASIYIDGNDTVEENSQSIYSCYATYDDGTDGEVSSGVSWYISQGSSVASINQSDGALTTTYINNDTDIIITVSYLGLNANKTVTVIDSISGLVEINGPDEIESGDSQQYTAIHINDGDVTNQYNWSVTPMYSISNGLLRTYMNTDAVTVILKTWEGLVSAEKEVIVRESNVPLRVINISYGNPDLYVETDGLTINSNNNYEFRGTYNTPPSEGVYWEIMVLEPTSVSYNKMFFGVASLSGPFVTASNTLDYYGRSSQPLSNNCENITYTVETDQIKVGTIISVAIKGNNMWIAKNNDWGHINNSLPSNPNNKTNPVCTDVYKKYPYAVLFGRYKFNFGDFSFRYNIPSGFQSLKNALGK